MGNKAVLTNGFTKKTQKELSELTGITQADISRIENGTRNPSLAMVKRIAAGLGMQLRLEVAHTSIKR